MPAKDCYFFDQSEIRKLLSGVLRISIKLIPSTIISVAWLFDHCIGEVQQATHRPAFICSVEIGFFIIITGHILDLGKSSFHEEHLDTSFLNAKPQRLSKLCQLVIEILSHFQFAASINH